MENLFDIFQPLLFDKVFHIQAATESIKLLGCGVEDNLGFHFTLEEKKQLSKQTDKNKANQKERERKQLFLQSNFTNWEKM